MRQYYKLVFGFDLVPAWGKVKWIALSTNSKLSAKIKCGNDFCSQKLMQINLLVRSVMIWAEMIYVWLMIATSPIGYEVSQWSSMVMKTKNIFLVGKPNPSFTMNFNFNELIITINDTTLIYQALYLSSTCFCFDINYSCVLKLWQIVLAFKPACHQTGLPHKYWLHGFSEYTAEAFRGKEVENECHQFHLWKTHPQRWKASIKDFRMHRLKSAHRLAWECFRAIVMKFYLK